MINLPTHDTQVRIASALEAIASAQGQEITNDWTRVVANVRKGYGPSLFPAGTQFTIVNGSVETLFDVVDHRGISSDGKLCAWSDVETGHASPGMMLQTHYAVENVVFDPKQAFFAASEALPAGTYNFKYGSNYYQFTTTVEIPVGGQITHDGGLWDSGFTLAGKAVHIFATPDANSEIGNAVISSGNGGTYLGEYYSSNLSAASSSNFNHIHRGSYGSNNYGDSIIEQWLNSDATSFVPQYKTKFMRRHPKHGAAGFMTRLPESFTSCIQTIKTSNWTNATFELGRPLSTEYTMSEKFFLPSQFEIFGTYEKTEANAKQFAYYVNAENADRIKLNRAGGSAQNWWMRSPYPSHAFNVRGVGTSGALNYYYASVSIGVAPACVIG